MIQLKIEFSSNVTKEFRELPYSEAATVRQALETANTQAPGLTVETFFDRTGSMRITSIDDVAESGGLRWLVSVNGESAGEVVEPSDLLGKERFRRLLEVLTLSDNDEIRIWLGNET